MQPALLTLLASRASAVAASVVVHAGVGAALLVGSAGHAAPSAAPLAPMELRADVDVEVAPPEETPEPEPKASPASTSINVSSLPPAHTHTHPYPVPATHDATPHDPSLVHVAESLVAPAPAALAAPALATEAPAALPRFAIAIGAGPSARGPVSAQGAGVGGSSAEATAAAAASTTVPESLVSVAARLVASAPASYPAAARANEIEADVPLEIVVDAAGAVAFARVVRHAGSGFDEAALAAIRRYRFSPAQREGRPVRVRMRWSVQFRLR